MCGQQSNALHGAFWGILFSLPVWLLGWFLICHYLGLLCLWE